MRKLAVCALRIACAKWKSSKDGNERNRNLRIGSGVSYVRRLIEAIPNAQVGRLRTTYCVREMEIFEMEMREMEMNEMEIFELEMVLAMS